MKTSAKPFSLGYTIAAGLALAVAFSLLSLFFLFMQARGEHFRLTGEVIAVESDSLNIRNASGEVTVLVVPPNAALHGVESVEGIEPGQHVMTKGAFTKTGTFEVERLRVLEGFDPR